MLQKRFSSPSGTYVPGSHSVIVGLCSCSCFCRLALTLTSARWAADAGASVRKDPRTEITPYAIPALAPPVSLTPRWVLSAVYDDSKTPAAASPPPAAPAAAGFASRAAAKGGGSQQRTVACFGRSPLVVVLQRSFPEEAPVRLLVSAPPLQPPLLPRHLLPSPPCPR